ncbi:efflux RND transporter periplasmic adaptor subunit [Nevskia soli]|uniref:efflux RND transporter periplasmic adaptor subunit n=1 Tax=Nevskia soli TaxID=418856 RepID=UPI00068B4FC1|nr:efflux RND transporter periplasmic adaptor subunit [Nevskia soli]
MKLTRNHFLITFGALAAAAALAWAYRTPSIPVDVVKVTRGPLEVTTEEDGIVRVRERYVVMPPVAGFMQRVAVHAGDRVTAGQTLFALEPLPPGALDVRARDEAAARVSRARSAVDAAEMNRRSADLQAGHAAREEVRARPLLESAVISSSDYDTIKSAADRTKAELEAAQASVRMARFELEAAQTALRYAGGERSAGSGHVIVTASVEGVVLTVHREDEGAVTAITPVLTIGDQHSLEVMVEVLSADAVRIRPGMEVRLERWGGPAPLQARVRTVEPWAFTKISALGVEEQRVRVVADLVSPAQDWTNLGDAYRVEARFVLWRSEDTLRLPHSCLFKVGPDWQIFVVQDGRAHRRAVEIGQRGTQYAQVLGGVGEGDVIILYPDDRLSDGSRVEPRSP